MPRLYLALFQILALILAPLASPQGRWTCPDGTACVMERDGQFHCAAAECAAPACCQVPAARKCRHGAYPAPDPGTEATLRSEEHCRFHGAQRLQAGLAPPAYPFHLSPADVALPPPAVCMPRVQVGGYASFIRACAYRPPPLSRTGPARAPPAS